LLGLVALGGAGIYAATRRRRSVITDEPVYEYESVSAEPVIEPGPPARLAQPGAFSSMVAPRPASTAPIGPADTLAEAEFVPGVHVPEIDVTTPARRTAAITDTAGSSGTGTAEPDERPDERNAILEEMIDRAPDEENPFTSRKARMRRARLILQGRESRGEALADAPRRVDLDGQVPAFSTNRLVDA